MAGKRSWSTKADIMKDLYQVSGKTPDVDEEFIIMGQKPPPPRRYENDDDEIQSRFGVPVDSNLSSHQDQQSPDLQGISNLIRMVDDYNDVEANTQEDPSPSSADVVYISKLDPSVPEFVPKVVKSSSSDSKENKLPNEQILHKQETLIKTKVEQKEQKEEEIDIGKKFDVSKLNADQINDISQKLRSKISINTTKDNLHSKRERNVAIATLLKIHSSAPKVPEWEETLVPEVSDKTLKLLSPQYFERPLVSKNVEKSKDVDENLLNNANSSQEFSQINEDSTTIEKEQDVTNAVPLVEKVPVENKHYEDVQVRESINKVNRWFQNPKSPKPKGPVVCLGPIEFKRKSNPRSPISSDVESKRSTPTKPVINQYKPSKYASELSKTFHDRVKTKASDDLWEMTYLIMKEKEEKMKLKNLEQSSVSRDDSTTDEQPSSSVN